MKVLLIRPPMTLVVGDYRPQACPPMGLAYVAAAARAGGHQVQVIDAVGLGMEVFGKLPGQPRLQLQGLPPEEVLARVPRDVDVIGFSGMFSVEWPVTRDLIEAVSRRVPRAHLICGGEHAVACTEYCMQDCPALDFILLGEGEEALPRLLEALERGEDPGQVPGLVSRRDGGLRRGPPAVRVTEVDRLPLPAWDLFPLRNYIEVREMMGPDLAPAMPVITSRGCPNRCTFCSKVDMWGPRWVARDANLVVDEMEHWHRQEGVTNFYFYDLSPLMRRDWVLDFSRRLNESEVSFTWQLPVGALIKVLDEEVMGLIQRAGCTHLVVAPESGSQPLLKRIQKKVDKPAMARAVGVAHRAGLKTKASFLIGLPDETLGDALRSWMFALRMGLEGLDDMTITRFSPHPGSALFKRLLQEGRISLDDDFFLRLAALHSGESFSQHLPGWSLSLLSTGGMLAFFSVSFTLRPWRVLALVHELATGRPTTRLPAALLRIGKRVARSSRYRAKSRLEGSQA